MSFKAVTERLHHADDYEQITYAMVRDLAVCAGDATFAFSEVRLGVIPAVISATVLRRLAPRAAAELYLTGDSFDGVRAAAIGLVTTAVAGDDIDQTVENYVAHLIRGAPQALAGAKALPRAGDIREELAGLGAMAAAYFTGEEGREGVRAFAEKRNPSWIPSS